MTAAALAALDPPSTARTCAASNSLTSNRSPSQRKGGVPRHAPLVQVPAAGWLGTSHTGLGRLRPAELADVLEGLNRTEIDSVVVLDESGRLAGDVPVFDLLVSDGGRPLADLIDPENP